MKHFAAGLAGLITLCLVLGILPLHAGSAPDTPHCLRFAGDPVPISADYGEEGTYTMVYEQFENTAWRLSAGGTEVTVFFPKELSGRAPVLFWSHGFGGTNWTGVRTLITHMVSRGFVVVHSPYPSTGTDVPGRYQIMWNGFQMAAERYATRMNLQKVGFLGHSFGAGAVPAMAWKGMKEQGWGTQGVFLFMLAPWYSSEMSDTQLKSFPAYMNMIVQVYDEDTINDHRMGIDIFNNMAIPDSQKAYYNVVPGTYPADHSVPSDRPVNELDHLAVRRPLDALIDYTFNISDPCGGKSYALDGQGDRFQHTVTKNPSPVAAESTYQWPWSSYSNPRR
ncbi:MAG: alpha/beta hydrolase [Alphaproteobacteria bacterium]|uniref:Alpha/beta hydrolase n=1 Tax=Candidatus Nitrobium versatile TaxID=2884831 RepID=A0A953M175_9BACT|nr:alpha/beta hydrolase [Candidatus Nitrobium versatile]